MKVRHALVLVLVLLVALLGVGCSSDSVGPKETIIFENRTPLSGLKCYIDNDLKGTVDAGQDLKVEGDFEGDRLLMVVAPGGGAVTRTQHIDKGMTFFWTLTF